jgi:cellulose synthase/poly-beta-1,6-N-acetylglucosamine synthase-like glycosyltransferase
MLPELTERSSDELAASSVRIFAVDDDTPLAGYGQFGAAPGGLALCITVYNEPSSALDCSLSALAGAVGALRREQPGLPVSICIVIDGLPKCAPSMRAALAQLAGAGQLALVPGRRLTCFSRKLLTSFEEPCFDAAQDDGELGLVDLFIAVKPKNCGKLDSHWWFYRRFCPALAPAYCVQMDVGTAPATGALVELCQAFVRDARVGAVASTILPVEPASARDLLGWWQYLSFANTMLLEWPAEVASGYLSVVPGQLSAIRWRAIDDGGSVPRHADSGGPLGVYFKGLGRLTPYESMLYSAEDRVLCREIVSAPQREWVISHADRALAVTDPCDSWEELFRQRKRWLNGYIACRANYLRRLPAFVVDPAISPHRKLVAARAGLYHAFLLANDWFLPAIAFLFVASLTGHAIALLAGLPAMRTGLELLSGAALAALVAQLSLCVKGRLSPRRIAFFRHSIGLQGSVAALALAVNLLLGESIVLAALFAFLCLALPLASLAGHRHMSRNVLKGAPFAVLNYYLVPAAIWMFAICNSHDNSWGTKGLLSSEPSAGNGRLAEAAQHAAFVRFRNAYASAWLGGNLCFGWAVLAWCRSSRHDPAIVALLITCAALAFGLVCRWFAALKRKIRRNR